MPLCAEVSPWRKTLLTPDICSELKAEVFGGKLSVHPLTGRIFFVCKESGLALEEQEGVCGSVGGGWISDFDSVPADSPMIKRGRSFVAHRKIHQRNT
ncbi:hypothetical protein AVEN_21970-1 [Araneus ventricosus]|uniref:Uncharacterized protein n=1 Tax=Araneus ventricosus TaxID=182803 RepID=A0A4Y2LF45_ARAVE|nr:hypothetical protein AVEN_21970-1 [Araneus ventricosus]